MQSDRRDFIKFVVTGSIAGGCPVEHALMATHASSAPLVDGESNEICHKVRDGYKFAAPERIAGQRDVIIVGGGISGLTAAWRLRGMNFQLLEKEHHWGGNAYLEEYHGQAFATGSAYGFKSDNAADLSKEIGIQILPVDDPDGLILNGEFVPHAWRSGLDHLPYSTAVRESFRKFKREMMKVDLKKRVKELDAIPLTDLLKGYAPELRAWWDTYGPSNWGAKSPDTSAWVALGDFQEFAADEPDDRATFAGGLGAISKKLSELLASSHRDHMLADATVIAVEQDNSSVSVTYSQQGEIKQVRGKTAIMATPKFITSKIVAGLPDAQLAAMKKIRYAPYPVINMIFDKPVFNGGYDTWCPGNTFTDVVVADWVIRNQPGYRQKNNILTFYTPLGESDRYKLLQDASCQAIAASVLRDWQKLMPKFNVDPIEIHMYRRGHPMFMATPGAYTQLMPAVRQPLGRIFFANTDSEGWISLTTNAIQAADRSVGEVKRYLKIR